jgi:outer membrane protein TolC
MTLTQAVAYARANQPAVRAGLSRIRAQQAEADVPRAQWEPTMGVTAQIFGATANNTTGTYVNRGFMDLPRIGATAVATTGTWRPYASTIVAAGVNQEIYDFGRIAAETAAEDALVDVERQRARGALLDVTYSVDEAYFAVFAAKAIVTASDGAYERARVHKDLASAGVGVGMREPIELTRAEADLTRFEVGRVKARGGLTNAQSVFAAAVGVPDATLDVADAPPAPAELPSLDDAVGRALARDPHILEALARIAAEEARTRAIGAENRPDISLSATLSGRAGGAPPSSPTGAASLDGWVPEVPNWDVGLVFTWPLFDASVNARVAASRAREELRRDELALVRHVDLAAIQQAYVAVEVARAALPALLRSVDAARANETQADARFRGGLGTSVELADAEALRADSEIQLAIGQFEIARARAAFGRAIAEGG